MARKTLLTESEIRQFMKLANLGPLGDAKIEEMYGTPPGNRDKEEHKKEMTEDEELEEARGDSSDEDGDEDVHEKPVAEEIEDIDEMGMRGPPMDRDEDEVMDDAEMDMGDAAADMGDAELDMDAADDDMDMGGMGDAEREEVMADVVRAVAQALGIEDQVSVEAGEDDGMEGGDMDAMPEPALDDEPALDAPDMEMGADDEEDEPMMEEEELEESHEDAIVAEVARRVAARLQSQNRREQVVDALAERIMKRLTK